MGGVLPLSPELTAWALIPCNGSIPEVLDCFRDIKVYAMAPAYLASLPSTLSNHVRTNVGA